MGFVPATSPFTPAVAGLCPQPQGPEFQCSEEAKFFAVGCTEIGSANLVLPGCKLLGINLERQFDVQGVKHVTFSAKHRLYCTVLQVTCLNMTTEVVALRSEFCTRREFWHCLVRMNKVGRGPPGRSSFAPASATRPGSGLGDENNMPCTIIYGTWHVVYDITMVYGP